MMTTLEKITDPISQWYQGSGIHAFMTWWTGELKAMVPSQYRNNLFPDSVAVYVTEAESEEDEVSFWQQDDGQIQELQLDDAAAEKSWWHQLSHYLGTVEKDTTLTYLMDDSNVLVRNVAMPVAVINDIESVLTFELDKYLPFKADEVEFAYSKGEVVEGSEKFPITLTAIKKPLLNRVIQSFETKGLQLTGIDVNVGSHDNPQSLGVNLMPKAMRKQKDWTKIKWNVGLLALAILLLWFVMFTSLDNKQAKIASLEDQVAELKKDARRAKLIENELNASIEAANFLGNLKKDTPSRLLMFKELTQKIPMNTFLTRIMIDQERLEVVGESDNANALVPILNQSSLWYEPRIIGNVTQGRTGKEKFTIRSEFKPAEELEVNDES
ncbi:PilN domain-containing protein [Marinicella marina]|uniref:PilN domain-containing protein n=1 Tax=Marinicella marina TaxID=2996016 RepID=UPI002260BA78|nr:PilN domain-containing protein [Marinicella marina]MDJ1139513.1 pilus assembly protein PilM [Marinicella marina]